MKKRYWIFSFGIVILFLLAMSIWGDKVMLLHPWRFMKSEWDKGAPIENFALSGIISSIDEGRGLKIRVSNLDTLLRINGLQAVNNNAKNEKNSFFEFGDSLIKLPDNDTFKIIRHDTTYIWKIAESSLNRH